MLKSKLSIVVVALVLVAAAGGLAFGDKLPFVGGPKAPEPKASPADITFEQPFIVNLADADATHYVKLGIAVRLEPMTAHDMHVFDAGGLEAGGHGASGPTGSELVAKNPALRDAVIRTVARFTSTELLTPAGKNKLTHQLLVEFDHVAQKLTPKPHTGADGKHKKAKEAAASKHEEHNAAQPPYHVQDVMFTEFAVQ